MCTQERTNGQLLNTTNEFMFLNLFPQLQVCKLFNILYKDIKLDKLLLITFLANFPPAQALQLCEISLQQVTLFHISQHVTLTRLHLLACEWSFGSLTQLRALSRLAVLKLRAHKQNNGPTLEEFECFASLPNLRKLSIFGTCSFYFVEKV